MSFLFSLALAVVVVIGLTILVIKFIPQGWRTRFSAGLYATFPVLGDLLDQVKDVDWSAFVDKRALAVGLGVGISCSILLLKKATVKAVKERSK